MATTNYFRLTVYHPTKDLSGIFDSHGKFEKLWEFSSYFIQKGFKVLEASSDEKLIDVDTAKVEVDVNKFFLRACCDGTPENVTCKIDGTTYCAVKVNDVVYVPDKEKTGGAI